MDAQAQAEQLAELVTLNHSGRYRELLQAAQPTPTSADGLFLAANAHYALEDLPEAWRLAHEILSIEPKHTAALTLLASIANLRGQSNLARELLESLDSLGPDLPEARLEMTQVLIAEGKFTQAIELINASEVLFNQPGWRARMHLLLGDAYDGIGQYQEAYENYSKKNQYVAERAKQLGIEDGLLQWGQRLLKEFTATKNEWKKLENASTTVTPQPIFIVGFPRSGTTLLQAKLEHLPEISALEERELWQDSLHRWFSQFENWYPLLAAQSADIAWAQDCYWQRVHQHLGSAPSKFFVDKFPMNVLVLPLIAKVFPGAHIIYCTREPMACIFSAFRRFIKPNSLSLACGSLANGWKLFNVIQEFMKVAIDSLPLQFHQLHYDDWMQDPDGEFARLVARLGLGSARQPTLAQWNDSLGRRPRSTPSTAQLTGGISDQFRDQYLNYRFSWQALCTSNATSNGQTNLGDTTIRNR